MKRYQRIILGYIVLAVLALLGANVIVASTIFGGRSVHTEARLFP